ncbi:MAG TPA: adenylate/guanylate cyclase domain-containing protein [Candidatus Limnocylindria bacterium]|jgi:class 3 adenylate cyclase|nr:adenylate/guanylate cyclase domain-containing protein [Candidatus Limnocylindria bacterium]
MAASSLAESARSALGRHAWREAYDLLADADRDGSLGAEELELLAEAAWWLGMLPTAIEVRERAYASAIKGGETEMAVIVAVWLARDHLFRNALSVASAWLSRADRLLEGVPENPGHGWVAATRGFHDALAGAPERTLEEATRAQEIGARFGDRNLEALAMSERGAALVAMGRLEEGLALVDEATVAAVGGELDPATAGGICCTTIESCATIGEWGRAVEWTEAQDRWCRREGISGYPGMCRLFRAEIKRLRGSWLEAEAEARRASDEMMGYIPTAVGGALYQIAEIRLARGDLPAAEEALQRIHALGTDPEPALSLLRLAQGNATAAAAGIRRALDEPTRTPAWRGPPGSDVYRMPLLAAQVEIALEADDVTTARAAADEMTAIAARYATLQMRATAAVAAGAVEVAEGDSPSGTRTLRSAVQAWLEFGSPYEAARGRLRLAEAYAGAGQAADALTEAESARAAFEEVGAIPALRRAETLIDGLRTADGDRAARTPRTARRAVRAFVFTDIVDSTRLVELLGDEAWSRLLQRHDEALRAVVAAHGGTEIKATGDGFFLAFEDPRAALDAAVGIQRNLVDQRAAHGFAPEVRVGIHLAEATRSGLDYIGLGVNQAARIGAAAGGGEILASAATVAAAGRAVPEAGRRAIRLKGVEQPVEVVSIAWR